MKNSEIEQIAKQAERSAKLCTVPATGIILEPFNLDDITVEHTKQATNTPLSLDEREALKKLDDRDVIFAGTSLGKVDLSQASWYHSAKGSSGISLLSTGVYPKEIRKISLGNVIYSLRARVSVNLVPVK